MFNERVDQEALFMVLRNKPLKDLQQTWKSANQKRARGQSILGGSYTQDETFLWNLKQLMNEKEAQKAHAPRTDEQRFGDEVERLRREHPGVSAKVARNYLQRQRQSKGDPLDVLRKDRLPAPDPEEQMEPARERHTEEPKDLRPHRLVRRSV